MINVALVGYGYWGPNLARVFSDLPDARLATICDSRSDRLQVAKNRFRTSNTCADFQLMLRNPQIDAVLIASPVSTHERLTQLALAAGKHVFVEKPLCMSYTKAKALVALAKQKKRILMVGHTFLYSPPVTKIKQYIEKGSLGRIYYMNSSRVNLGLFQPDASVFWDLAPHDISMYLYWLEQDPLWVCAEASSYVRKNIFEVGFATLQFPKGILAHLHVSWLAPYKFRQTTIVGSKRMVLYDDGANNEKVKLYNQGVVRNPETFGEFQLTYRSGDVVSPHLEATEPLHTLARDFIKSIQTKTTPKSSSQFGAQVVRILEAIQLSTQKKGKVYWLK